MEVPMYMAARLDPIYQWQGNCVDKLVMSHKSNISQHCTWAVGNLHAAREIGILTSAGCIPAVLGTQNRQNVQVQTQRQCLCLSCGRKTLFYGLCTWKVPPGITPAGTVISKVCLLAGSSTCIESPGFDPAGHCTVRKDGGLCT